MFRKSQPLFAVAFFGLLVTVLGPSLVRGQAPAAQGALPDGPGKNEVQTQCTKCHALGLITNAGGNTRQEWIDLFSTMVSLPKDQSDAISAYLAKNFPPQPRPTPVVI